MATKKVEEVKEVAISPAVAEVNRLVKQVEQMKKMMKQMPGLMKRGRRGGFGRFPF